MFKRVNRLAIELPNVEYGDANAASAVQELLGGKFGEMSTLNNYMYQSFNFRGKKKLKPFYDLVASITAEEFGHVELVATTINLLNKGNSFCSSPRFKLHYKMPKICVIRKALSLQLKLRCRSIRWGNHGMANMYLRAVI